MENTLSEGLYATGEHAAYDAACKRLLAEKIILAWIMKRCVSEFRDVDVDDIAEKYIEGTPQIGEVAVAPDETNAPRIHAVGGEDATLTEGTVFYDIRFHAVAPKSGELIRLIINVEAQNDYYPGYPLIRRALYYCSRMISAQYGTEFIHSHYENIKKVYSIWICSNPPKNRQNSIAQYSVTESLLTGNVQENREDYDLLTSIMIYLGDGEESQDELLHLLEVLFSETRLPAEKCRILEEDFRIEMSAKMEGEVSDMCNLSKGVYERGVRVGEIRGEARGEARGTENTTLLYLRNLMASMNLTVLQAMELMNVPLPDREKYAALLAQ